uniref:Piezo-type mechanosensitive ion channel component n=1 Tax=Esox lucius TaxID=8010 RepID=A0AAY5L846_ESOLU
MASQVVCGLIFRLLLPVCLAAACLFRYNGLSLVYLIYLLLIPLFSEPTRTTMQGHTGRLLKSLCFTSLAFLLLHVIYQITINSLLAGDSINPNFNCSTWEKALRQLGLENVRGADAGNGIRVFIPDIGMFVAGLVTWILCLSLEEKPQGNDALQQHNAYPDNQEKMEEEEEEEEEKREEEFGEDHLMFEEDFETGEDGEGDITGDEVEEAGEDEGEEEEESTKMKMLRQMASVASKVKEIVGNLITTAGKVVVTVLLGLTGVMLPSLTSAVYFFTFLALCTWWSFCRNFDPLVFSCLCVLMAIFSAGHLLVLYLYQFQFFQELIPPGDSYASLFGISSVVQTDCSYTWMFRVNPALAWHHYVNPIMLLVLYYTLATLIRLWLQDPADGVSCLRCNTGAILAAESYLQEQGWSSCYEDLVLYLYLSLFWSVSLSVSISLPLPIPSQAWSITYVSWLTFVFLIWSCTLWMVRDRRRYAMVTSPFMVFYGNLLIILQYIWSFEVLRPVPGLFLKKEVPFRELGSKMLCLLSFWLLLRQALTERKERQRGEEGSGGHREMMQVLGSTLMAMMNKYWIYICGGMFFFVSFEGRIVMYKIIYMMLFLFCVACYQVNYEWWRRMLKYFWMSVVVYTMLVLILVYTFQFDSSIHVWSNMTGMSKEKLKDLGLEKFSVPALFTRIFIPTSFLLVCILHLHYFHQRFLLLTDIKTMADQQKSTISRCRNELCSYLRSKWHLVVDRLTVLFLKFLQYFQQLQLTVWWLLELHIVKIVSSYIIWVSVKEVSLFNYVFLVSWAFALPFSQFRPLASSVCTVWTCVLIVCKMLYQLTSINPSTYSKNCSMPLNYTEVQRSEMARSLLYSGPVDPANWVGLRKFSPLLENLRVTLLAFEVTIYRHQDLYRMRSNLTAPVTRTVFHDITRQHLDDGILNCAKYFINYFFYKFGLETCFLLAVNVIGQRMDFYATLHAFGLIMVIYRRQRKAIAEIWPKYCFFLACMLTWQYLVCIGFPPAACKDYPWRFPSSITDSNVIKWLYFPDFHTKPNPLFLLYDFMLLLCASLQRQVFEEENEVSVRLLAGDNIEICRDLDAASFSQHNPVPDFIHCRSYLDMLKVIMFSYLFWFVLTIIFITGTTRISIFCMGYLVACFYFLLFGGELLLKPIKSILHYWDFLIAYNVFVITMKNILSILACGYIKALVTNHCWLIQLFSLACTIKGYSKPEQQAHKHCELPSDEAGIIWDSICFAFLLLQRRVFMSYYFLHVVADIRSSQILASRGAELFQATIVKAVKARIEVEKKSMDLLKRHVFGFSMSFAALSVVRSGNYYLFETDSEEEEEEEDKKEAEQPKKSAFQVHWNRVFNIVKFSWVLFLAMLDSFTAWINSMCQEHIDISTVLRIERCIIHCSVRGLLQYRPSTGDAPGNSLTAKICLLDNSKGFLRAALKNYVFVPVSLTFFPSPPFSFLVPSPALHVNTRMFYDEELEDSERFYGNQPALLQLLYALYNVLVAHSEMVCYLVIILNHMISASVATLVLPILIFLWAMLSVPRPSKRFWMTAIVYTEVTIVIKYFFQFGFFPFNQNIELDKSKPFHPPNIIGVEKKEGYVHYDLVQLLALFFHRSILKVGRETLGPDMEKRSRSRREEKQASGRSSSLLESVRTRLPRHPLSTFTQQRRKSSSSTSHLSQRTLRSTRTRGGKFTRHEWPLSWWYFGLFCIHLCIIGTNSLTMCRTLEIYVPIRQFFYNLIHPEYSAVTDVYVLMFLADTVDFIIIVFGFWAFGKHSAAADITSSLSEDQVPEAFLVMVLIQFGTMVVDRALYLRKTVMGKVIFQVILVFGIHFWMFFILPGVTERRFSQNAVAQLWYFFKCIYFGLSAYQIRCGYPTRVLGNFLTKSYNYLNLFLFQGFRLVPFLTELRAVMDWVWTDTTLSLSSWICVEDIYAHIFVLKCWRMSEKRYPQPRGQKKKKVVKYGMGGMIVMLLICIVWFPLLFMSLVKSVAGVVNKPLDVSVTITLGGFQPIFTMSAQQNQVPERWIIILFQLPSAQSAMQFLEAYTSEDVTVAELEGSSNSLWTISPPSRNNLMDVLSKEEHFPVTIALSIISYMSTILDNSYKNILLDLERTHNSSGEIQEWWIVDQPSAGQIQMRSAALGKKREAGLKLYVFSDKVSPPSLGFLAGYGIMGLYASVVLVIGKFVREFFSGISHSIMFEELPAVDRILKLCTDIFLVRETGELELEEDLYAKLIFLYRSPETMIKWTRAQKTK